MRSKGEIYEEVERINVTRPTINGRKGMIAAFKFALGGKHDTYDPSTHGLYDLKKEKPIPIDEVGVKREELQALDIFSELYDLGDVECKLLDRLSRALEQDNE